MSIYMTARWQCRPGAEEKVLAALREFVGAVGRNEPQTLIYIGLQEMEAHNSFMTFFSFADEAARQGHQDTEWVKRFTETIYPENIESVVFTEYRKVASTEDPR